MPAPRTSLLLALVATAAALLGLAAAPAWSARVAKVGTLAAVPQEDARGTYDYWLRSGETERKLRFARAPRVELGARVRVAGDQAAAGGAIAVTSVQEIADAPEPLVAGERRVLVMRVNWTEPDALTDADAMQEVGVRSSNWYAEVSDGLVRLASTVTPWLTIPETPCGDYNLVHARAAAAAAAAGYVPETYDHEVVYFPHSPACAWAGLGWLPGRVTWFNGVLRTRELVHELGHNLGLHHANTLTCRDGAGAFVAYSEAAGACTSQEYAHPFDAMGASANVGHFNAANKEDLGWLGGRSQVIGPGDSVTLTPYVGGAGLRAAIVPTPTGRFVVEFRRPEGLDLFLTGFPQATSGVLVHDASGGFGRQTNLLDGRPDSLFSTPALEPGASVALSGGIALRVDAASPAEARISVVGPDREPPTVASITPDADAVDVALSSVVEATFSEPVDEAATQAGFTLTRASDGAPVAGTATWSGTTLTFDPDADLEPATAYVASAAAGGDQAGNALVARSWTFTTANPAPGDAPVDPAPGGDGTAEPPPGGDGTVDPPPGN